MNKPFVVVSCPLDTYSGYGSRARDIVRALMNSEKYDVKVLSQRWGSTPFGFLKGDNPEDKKLLDCILPPPLQRKPDVWIQITVPNEFQNIGTFNIGITAGIETDICTPQFIEGCNRMNLVLASSNHTKNIFEKTVYDKKNKEGKTEGTVKLETSVEVLFEGVDLEKYFHIPPKELPKTELVNSLNEIKEQFSFLFVGHWLKGAVGEDRKNVGLLIKTFLETFRNKSKQPALVLKTMGGSTCLMDREDILKKIDAIRKGVNGKLPNIYLIHGEIDDSDMNHLYNHPKIKAMISLTKGEVFGRPLLEFTQSKKPVISTNFSGHLDFLDKEFASLIPGELKPVHESAIQEGLIIKESKWFAPNIDFVQLLLKDYFGSYKAYEVKGKQLGYRCKTKFSFDQMSKNLIEIIDKNAPKKVEIKLPNIKKISLPKKS